MEAMHQWQEQRGEATSEASQLAQVLSRYHAPQTRPDHQETNKNAA